MGLTVDGNLNLQRLAVSIGASQNDYNPAGLSETGFLAVTATAGALSITGLQGGVEGRVMIIANVGTNDITLANESASSTAANRFAAGQTLFVREWVWLVYLGSRWRTI